MIQCVEHFGSAANYGAHPILLALKLNRVARDSPRLRFLSIEARRGGRIIN